MKNGVKNLKEARLFPKPSPITDLEMLPGDTYIFPF